LSITKGTYINCAGCAVLPREAGNEIWTGICVKCDR